MENQFVDCLQNRLDPEGDPLSVLLMIDFYALRSEQYDYLLSLYEEWEPTKRLSLLPNYRYSTSLALFYMSQKSPELIDRADHSLQEALIMFPEMLPQLLDRCSVEPDHEVAKCDYFKPSAQKTTQVIGQLTALYVGRTHLLWKDRDVMSWLERNTRQVIGRLSNNDPFVLMSTERYWRLSDFLTFRDHNFQAQEISEWWYTEECLETRASLGYQRSNLSIAQC